MSYQVIARKWRPQTFEDVTGQEAITQTLRNALEHDRLHHAYLFSGARGVGKTTTARLLAKALNCHKTTTPNPVPCAPDATDACPSCREIAESRSIDVFEFDAASHTGVDDIREIILDSINVAPARDRYKVFIIDEVHMLSNSSFNALLKTLEEPPPNVVFVMATTELHKVPVTILSRCQEFEFRTIALAKIFERLKLIAAAEQIAITDEALREIARSGEGSMRDAQSNFDQVISFSGEKIDVPDVANALGLAGADMLVRIVTAVAHQKPIEALTVVDELISRGHDLRNYCRDLLAFFRDLLVAKVSGGNEHLLETASLPPDELIKYATRFTEADLIRCFHSLSETETKLRDATQSRHVLEIGLVKLIEMGRVTPIEELLKRLADLESVLGGVANEGAATAPTPEKKTLKVDFPLAEVPFPTGRDEITAAAAAPEHSSLTEEIPADSPEKSEASADTVEPPAPNRLEKVEPPADHPDELPAPVHSVDFADEPPDFIADRLADLDDLAVSAGERNNGRGRNAGRYEYIANLPVKLAPISAEDLEHFDDEKLDAAYEQRLRREGDELRPLRTVIAEVSAWVTAAAFRDDDEGAVTNGNRRRATLEIPVFEDDTDDGELPVLSASPTAEELRAYATKHPKVKKILRAFRGQIVDVRQKS